MLRNIFFLYNEALPCFAAQGRKNEAQFSDLGSQSDSCGEFSKEQQRLSYDASYKVL